MEFLFDEIIRTAAPGYELIAVEAAVANFPTQDALWQEIELAASEIRRTYAMEQIRHRPAIAATKGCFTKALGKRTEPLSSVGRSIVPTDSEGS